MKAFRNMAVAGVAVAAVAAVYAAGSGAGGTSAAQASSGPGATIAVSANAARTQTDSQPQQQPGKARVPNPGMLYEGRIKYPTRSRSLLWVKISDDGRRLKIAPSFSTNWRKCGASGGEFMDAFIPSKTWLRVKPNRTFSGKFTLRKVYTPAGYDYTGVYRFHFRGRFTRANRASGRLTVNAELRHKGRKFLTCKKVSATWRTIRVMTPERGWDF